MNETKLRLYTELADLKDKIAKLNAFIKSEKFNKLEEDAKMLLLEQFHIMNAYTLVLVKRIDIFNE